MRSGLYVGVCSSWKVGTSFNLIGACAACMAAMLSGSIISLQNLSQREKGKANLVMGGLRNHVIPALALGAACQGRMLDHPGIQSRSLQS